MSLGAEKDSGRHSNNKKLSTAYGRMQFTGPAGNLPRKKLSTAWIGLLFAGRHFKRVAGLGTIKS
jgi:hypothetical protein